FNLCFGNNADPKINFLCACSTTNGVFERSYYLDPQEQFHGPLKIQTGDMKFVRMYRHGKLLESWINYLDDEIFVSIQRTWKDGQLETQDHFESERDYSKRWYTYFPKNITF